MNNYRTVVKVNCLNKMLTYVIMQTSPLKLFILSIRISKIKVEDSLNHIQNKIYINIYINIKKPTYHYFLILIIYCFAAKIYVFSVGFLTGKHRSHAC